MIDTYYVLLTGPMIGDESEPKGPIHLPGVPSAGDRVKVDWENDPEGSQWFIVDHIRWWPGEHRADIVGNWADETHDCP